MSSDCPAVFYSAMLAWRGACSAEGMLVKLSMEHPCSDAPASLLTFVENDVAPILR